MKPETDGCIQAPQRYIFIFTVVAVLSLVACASSKTKTAVEDSSTATEIVTEEINNIIHDPERAERVSSLAAKIFKENEAFIQSAINTRLQASELGKDYNTSPDAFDTLFEALFKERRERSERMIGYTIEMRSLVNASEWAEINKALTARLTKNQSS